MIIIELDIYTGVLEYKGINFSFVFDKQELRLIPPKDKKKEIEHEWFMHKIGEGVYAGGDHPQMERPFLVGVCNEDGNKSLRKESKVVQTKKQYGDFSLTALSFASISIFSG